MFQSKNAVFVTCLLLSALVATSGCIFNRPVADATQLSEKDFLTFESGKHGVKIKFPKTWELDSMQEGSFVVSFKSPAENDSDEFAESLNITIENLGAEPVTIQEYTTASFTIIAAGFPDIEVVESGSLEISGLVANKIVYTATMEGKKMEAMNVWIIDGQNRAHVLTFLGEAKNYAKYKDIVDFMARSYEILPPQIKEDPFKRPGQDTFERPQDEKPADSGTAVSGEQKGGVETEDGKTDETTDEKTGPAPDAGVAVKEEAGAVEAKEGKQTAAPAVELADPTALLAGKWRALSKYAYYDSGGSAAMQASSTILLYLNADKTWGYGTSSGTWNVSEITQADWAKWKVEPFGAKYRLTLEGWQGGSADGPVEQSAQKVDFVWAIYRATPDETTTPAQVQMKFGKAP